MATPAHTLDLLIVELRALLGRRLSTSEAVRQQHGKDESFHEVAAPDAVAFADTGDEVQTWLIQSTIKSLVTGEVVKKI